MYSGEPITSPVAVSCVESCSAAMPKSVSTALPSMRSRTLPGLTSRCMIPAACAARSAASTSRPMRAVSAGDSAPSRSRDSSDVPRTSSMTIHGYGESGDSMIW